MKAFMTGILALALLAGCAETDAPPAPGDTAAGNAPEPAAAPDAGTAAASAETPAGAAPPGTSGDLGTTIASLGNPAEPGLWLRTPLVAAPGRGRIEAVETGRSATVRLIPVAGEPGAGSRMSLAAFQAVGAALTDLPELRVIGLP